MNAIIEGPDLSAEREQNRRERPPSEPLWKSYYHVLYTLVFCALGILLPLSYVVDVRWAELLVIPGSFVAANFVEYVIHRWPMHRKYPGAEVMLKLHMVHHNYFYQDTYQINGFRDYAMIVFPPIVLNILAFGLAPLLGGAVWWLLGKNWALLFYATVMGYYLLMQFIHVACHLDASNKIVAIPGVHYLWKHHEIHHNKRFMAYLNFNFIVPIADFVFATNEQDAKNAQRRVEAAAVSRRAQNAGRVH